MFMYVLVYLINAYINVSLSHGSLEGHIKVVYLSILVISGDQVINFLVETFYSSLGPYYGFLVWWCYHCLAALLSFTLANAWICWEANTHLLEFRRVTHWV